MSARDKLLAELPALVALVRAHADETERARNLAAPVAAAFKAAGLFRLSRPSSLNGLELDPLTTLHVLEELAAADGSSAWSVMASGVQGMENVVPLDGAAEMFSDRNVVAGGVAAPGGRAIAVDGGYRVTGRWPMASNCKQCDWLGAGAALEGDGAPRTGAKGMPPAIFAFIPASECRILDTWDVSGLRGTGSHDFEVTDVFVPQTRCAQFPLTSPHSGALYVFPFFSFIATTIASVAIGIARRALDEFRKVAQTKTASSSTRGLLAERAYAQHAVPRAEAAYHASRAWMFNLVTEAWARAQRGERASVEERALLRLAATNAAHSAASAVDLVYTAGGATSLYTKSPLQRCFRDVHAITQHISVALTTYELTGKVLLGVETDPPLL